MTHAYSDMLQEAADLSTKQRSPDGLTQEETLRLGLLNTLLGNERKPTDLDSLELIAKRANAAREDARDTAPPAAKRVVTIGGVSPWTLPTRNTISVHEDRLTILIGRLQRLAHNDAVAKLTDEADDVRAVFAGFAAAARLGLRSVAIDDVEKMRLYNRVNDMGDEVAALERGT